MNMTDSLLELVKIAKSFQQPDGSEIVVLREISFTLSPGESVALMGANGSGKTTLLRIILGSHVPTRGEVVLMGKNQKFTPAHMRAQLIGSVHQDSYKSLASELTVEEVLSIAARRSQGLKLKFFDFKSINSQLEELSQETSEFIRDRKKVVTSNLSGGQCQMIAIICALLGSPKILLLDEHLASLDDNFTHIANNILNQFVKERNGACIVVTHNEIWSQIHCDHLGRIENGSLVFYH